MSTHLSQVTCEPHCYLALSARCVYLWNIFECKEDNCSACAESIRRHCKKCCRPWFVHFWLPLFNYHCMAYDCNM